MRLLLALGVWVALIGAAVGARAQNQLPTPTPLPATPAPLPTATALPSKTPTVAATPSPASLPSVVPNAPTRIAPDDSQPIRGFGDPNRVILPAPVVAPTATPAPTVAPIPTGVPEPIGGVGDVTGTETPDSDFSLDSPGGLLYDMERGLTLAQGAVTFRYRNFLVHGDRGVINNATREATLSGNLTVKATVGGASQTFTGQSLVFNLDTGKWLLSQLRTTFPPDYFPPGTVLANLYETNGTVRGQGEGARGENFRFSSCDRDHYYIRSNRIEFTRTPGGQPQRIILRKNALFVFGREILPLPVYAISLLGERSRRQPLQTTFGENAIDGYFAKSIYDLRATAKATDSVLLDALSKRGLGLGLQREFVGGGLLYLYAVSGKSGGREINSRVQKRIPISRQTFSDVNFQTTQNNSLSGYGIASRTGSFSLQNAGNRSQSSANYNFDSSHYSTSGSRTDSLLLQHTQRFGGGYSLIATGDLNQSQFSSSATDATPVPKNQTGDLNVQLGKNSRAFDLFLRTELHNDFARGNKAFQLERLPELLLQSDSRRLQLGALNHVVPGTLTFGVGTFNEPSFGGSSSTGAVGGQKSRADFFYNFSERSLKLVGTPKNGSLLRAAGTFEQAFYSDSTARYNYAYNLNNTSNLGPIQVAVNYNKQRTYGFTPFQFDYSTPGENVDYTASVGRGENFRLNLSGGRDIQHSYTRDILTNLQWIPTRGAYVSLGTSYGLQAERKNKFGDIYGNLRFSRAESGSFGGRFALGFRYTPSGTGRNQGLTRVNGSFDGNISRKIRFQALAGYDGISRRFDFQQYRAIVDLHCVNLFTTYDGSRKELRFDLALKAFPFADTRFGRNGFSQGFDAGVGEVR